MLLDYPGNMSRPLVLRMFSTLFVASMVVSIILLHISVCTLSVNFASTVFARSDAAATIVYSR